MKRLDRLEANIENIKDTMERNTVSLEDHMRRTDLLENRLYPLERAHSFVTLLIKTIPILTALLAAVYYLIRITHGS